jgi:DNA-binding transcriptional LysR family regulator
METSSSDSGPGELPHVATFVTVAEKRGFTAAAAELGITQAAVSQRIAALESELRVSLFDRRAGRIALTEAGQRLYRHARSILDLHHQARAEISGFRPAVSGDLAIAASSVPGEFFLPALLSAFHHRYPAVHVQATVSDSRGALQDVIKGRATVGLVGNEADKPSLEFRAIGGDTLVLVVAPGHRFAVRKRIPLKVLAGEPLIVREQGSGSRRTLEKGLERSGTSLAELNVRMELGSNAAIKDAVKRGTGIAFLSRLAVKRELDTGELLAVAVGNLSLHRRFFLVYHRRRPLSPSATAFLEFLASHPIGRKHP